MSKYKYCNLFLVIFDKYKIKYPRVKYPTNYHVYGTHTIERKQKPLMFEHWKINDEIIR